MPALNRVQLIGCLGKDPESRYTPIGKTGDHFQHSGEQPLEIQR